MSCKNDDDCASTCCSTAMNNGSSTCHAVIQGSFCPRALAPKVDYSMYVDHKVDYIITHPQYNPGSELLLDGSVIKSKYLLANSHKNQSAWFGGVGLPLSLGLHT